MVEDEQWKVKKEAKAKKLEKVKIQQGNVKKTKILFDIWVWGMEDEQRNLKVKSTKSENKFAKKFEIN